MQERSGSSAAGTRREPHPVVFEVAYPERVSRLSTFFRLILAIPQLVVIYLLSIVLSLLTFVAWWAILFTGRYPRSIFDLNVGFLRWIANVNAYMALLRDEYPPFSTDRGNYPVLLDIPPAERQSRWRLFVRLFSVIPNQIVFFFVSLAWYVTTTIAWFAILITGRYPRGLHRFGTGVLRWSHRQQSYSLLLRDEYPPYSTNPSARPGNEVVSAVIGFPILALYLGFYAFYWSAFVFQGGGSVETSLGAIEATHPSAHSRSLRITLEGYDDNVRVADEAGSRVASFDVQAEKEGWWPAFFSPYLFFADLCGGVTGTGVDDVTDETTQFTVYWRGGSDTATIYFVIPERSSICELSYFTFTGQIKFEFQ